MGTVTLEPFYGGAARSMSQSWHDFVFGSLDPWGTVSVDKLPGALWFQALSLRLFGFHLWAIVLPQVIEGTLTVLVLFRAVRRVAGPGAGLVAAAVLAVSPVTVLLNRGNISDSLLILLLVLAADAATKAVVESRWRTLLVAGVWVGLAFQAKMLQAWLVLPALYLAYLIAAPATGFLRRCGQVVLSVAVVAVVSLSYMTAVAVVPAHDRPYVDGSCNDSIYSQVFVYNGLDRFTGNGLDGAGCNPPSSFIVVAARRGAVSGVGTFAIPSGWDRLLVGVFARDDAWVLVPSVVAAVGLLVLRRRRPRTDALRAAVVLWSSWLVVTAVFFSQGRYLNSYYLAALIPPMAALCGLGAAAAWRYRASAITRAVVLATVALSTTYAVSLTPGDVGVRPAILASTIGVAALCVAVLAASLWRLRRPASVWTRTVGLGLGAIALLSTSAWATTSVLVTGEGPFDSPYQPARVTFDSQTVPAHDRAEWPLLDRYDATIPYDHAVDVLEPSAVAGYDIMATGHEYLPVGGFTGRVPAPTVAQFRTFVAEGRVTRVVAALRPLSNAPVMQWVTRHCAVQQFGTDATFTDDDTFFQRYICSLGDAGH
jgi:4-amino-4-deoxy-L-arabinose transferase-like glycosyltransferase